MKKLSIILYVYLVVCANANAQHEIIYRFDSCVIDSLKIGMNTFAKLENKPLSALKFYAIVKEDAGEYEIYLESYLPQPKRWFFPLVKETNRKIFINSNTSIPVIFTSDIQSNLVKNKVPRIPLSGYYLKIIYEKYVQKVVKSAMLF